jgi:hypothetical protein
VGCQWGCSGTGGNCYVLSSAPFELATGTIGKISLDGTLLGDCSSLLFGLILAEVIRDAVGLREGCLDPH